MSFGNTTIFPFPAVQYIPLVVTTLKQEIINNLKTLAQSSQLIAGPELIKWSPLLVQDHQIELPEKFSTDSFPVLALNLKVSAVKYRGYFVTMIGLKNYGYYHLFTLPQKYFYKNKLCFELFDENVGERLARYSLFIP